MRVKATAGRVVLVVNVLAAGAALCVVGARYAPGLRPDRLWPGLLRTVLLRPDLPDVTPPGPATPVASAQDSPVAGGAPPAEDTPQGDADGEPAGEAPPRNDALLRDEQAASSPATPAEVLAARFPSAGEAAGVPPPAVMPGGDADAFDLGTLSGIRAVAPRRPDAGASARLEEPGAKAEPPGGPASGGPAPGGLADAPRRLTARSANVLNDAMIASIRQRLRLTADQQKLWPAVEAALRKIVYTKAAMNPPARGPSGPIASIDPASAEVQELKTAALPLIMRLNAEQKREVKALAYVMGLESVASLF